MKTLFKLVLSVLTLLLFSSSLFSQQQEVIEKYSKLRITIQDRSDITKLQRAGISVEGMKVEEQSVEIILSEREILKLKELGFPYEILIDDMTRYYQERSRRTETEMKNLEREMKEKYSSGGFGFGSMGGFYTYDEVVAELDTMRMLYPNLITVKYSIGTTIEGRTIWAAKISDNPDIVEGEPEVFYNSLIHAREPAGMMSVIYFMYHLLENYGTDPEITYLVDNRELYFVPCINVDGYEYNYQMEPNGGYMWRKNKRDNNLNGTFEEGNDGVDLNRNFGYMWGYNNIGSSPDSSRETYRGTAPFSEPETQVLRYFCNNHNFNIAVNFHSYWNVIFTSWEYNLEQTPDSNLFNNTISLATVFNGYENGWYISDSYELNGSANDWMYGEQTSKPKIYAYLPEVGNDNDGFWPIPDRIFPIAEENCYPNKVFAWGPGVIDNPPYISEADINPSTYLQQGDSIVVSASESNPQNYNSVVTAYVINSENVTVDEFEMTETTANNFVGMCNVPFEEDLYRILLKDSGVEIPSNFYFTENSRFTTAGPIVIDSLLITYSTFNKTYRVYPFVHNLGQTFTVKNLAVAMSTDDTTIISLFGGNILIDSLSPGEVLLTTGSYSVRVDTNFTLPFRFNFTIKSDGWIFWRDSISIVTGDEEGELQPLTFKLEQNYPNPFNPSTKIKYSVAQTSQVQIKIFDVLGSEIETLVNEEKTVGIYELNWNAVNIPSGVYFYLLNAGEFTAVKKMILLK